MSPLTAEAELMAVKEAFAQAIHLRALLKDLETPQRNATTIFIDSQAAFQASNGENFSKRLKHANVALQWVWEMTWSNTLSIELIRTSMQDVDSLTKLLPREQHEACCKLVGLLSATKEKTEDEDLQS